MEISSKGIELIKHFEGCRLVAYHDPAGVLTIGYGHTRGVRSGERITQGEADNLLKGDLKAFSDGVEKLVDVHLNQNQFDALVSFAYNLGLGNLEASTLLEKLNQGNFKGASEEFGRWIHAGGKVLQGLVKRREAERELFDTPAPHVVNKSVNKFTSIVDYLKAHHMPSDFSSRRELARKHGIHPYSGRAEENIKLLNILQG